MTNTDVWDRIAARRSAGDAAAWDVVSYGHELPSDADLKLTGDVSGKRVLDLGCGAGENAIVLARRGAHVIALDTSRNQLALAKKLADAAEIRMELHESDVADLAFLRADSIDLALAVNVLGEVEDIDRVFRQVHRVLRPGAAFVFSIDHPASLAIGRPDVQPGELPLGALEVRRSYFAVDPIEVTRDDDRVRVYPRTIADVFAGLHRAGYRVDVVLEPEPLHSADPGPAIPSTVIWRARKVGV